MKENEILKYGALYIKSNMNDRRLIIGSISAWNQLVETFLDRFYPTHMKVELKRRLQILN